jgi:hypothetical protein
MPVGEGVEDEYAPVWGLTSQLERNCQVGGVSKKRVGKEKGRISGKTGTYAMASYIYDLKRHFSVSRLVFNSVLLALALLVLKNVRLTRQKEKQPQE